MDQPARRPVAARFLTGSTMGHVVTMTLTGAIGLMSVFMVDLADLYFLSLLGRTEITAAIGFAGTAAFANLSISLGLAIAASALVARNLGAGNVDAARRLATSAMAVTAVLSLAIAAAVAAFATPLLRLLGASGASLAEARVYLVVLTPGFVLLALSITASFILRAVADPRRAMYVTLSAAVVNGVLDPLFIFGLGLDMPGAAIATVCANAVALTIGLHGMVRVHGLLARPRLAAILDDLKPILAIAVPAILTQLATPFAVAYLTRVAAQFGDEMVAATAIINRVVPVAFGIVFSLAGAVGPIIGQNYGARRFDRVRGALTDALAFCSLYTVLTALTLMAFADAIPGLFRASPETAALVTFFCTWLGLSWSFAGAQFVAQAAFNNLGKPHWATLFNWGKATLGTIPVLHAGAVLGGAPGMLVGQALGAVAFGVAAALAAYRLVVRLEREAG